MLLFEEVVYEVGKHAQELFIISAKDMVKVDYGNNVSKACGSKSVGHFVNKPRADEVALCLTERAHKALDLVWVVGKPLALLWEDRVQPGYELLVLLSDQDDLHLRQRRQTMQSVL